MVGNPLTVKLIESTINRSIRDIKTNPDKGLKSLADLANRFASNPFQKDLINTLQSSDYIIPFLVGNVNHPTIKTFIVNMAYNSLSYGAKQVRQYNKVNKQSVSWAKIFDLSSSPGNQLTRDKIISTISQEQRKGVYTYLFFTDNIDDFQAIVKVNPDCAFLLFVPPKALTRENILKVKPYHNTLFSVLYEPEHVDDFTSATRLLLSHNCLFGSHTYYKDDSVGDILRNKWLGNIMASKSPFAFLIESKECSKANADFVHEYVYNSKTNTGSPAFLIDLYEDIAEMDQQLSEK